MESLPAWNLFLSGRGSDVAPNGSTMRMVAFPWRDNRDAHCRARPKASPKGSECDLRADIPTFFQFIQTCPPIIALGETRRLGMAAILVPLPCSLSGVALATPRPSSFPCAVAVLYAIVYRNQANTL